MHFVEVINVHNQVTLKYRDNPVALIQAAERHEEQNSGFSDEEEILLVDCSFSCCLRVPDCPSW